MNFKAALGSLLLLVAALSSPSMGQAAEPPVVNREAAVREKLMRVVIPHLNLRDASLREALDFLKQKTMSLDPSPEVARDTSISATRRPAVRKAETIPRLDAAGDTAESVKPSADSDGPRITLNLWKIPVWEALRYIAEIASMKISVGEHSVELIPYENGAAVQARKPAVEAKAAPSSLSAIERKFAAVVVPQAEFREASLREILDHLQGMSAQVSDAPAPARNIVYVPRPPSEGAQASQPLSLAMNSVPLNELLRKVASLAGADIAFEEYAVVLRARATKR